MNIKKKTRKRVYAMYLQGVPLEYIATEIDISELMVEEIIDYMNEIYV